MIDLGKIDDIVNRLSAAIPPEADRLKEDIETRFKAVLKSAFERMDLVTREEFDIQKSVLERTRIKLEALERQLEDMENNSA